MKTFGRRNANCQSEQFPSMSTKQNWFVLISLLTIAVLCGIFFAPAGAVVFNAAAAIVVSFSLRDRAESKVTQAGIVATLRAKRAEIASAMATAHVLFIVYIVSAAFLQKTTSADAVAFIQNFYGFLVFFEPIDSYFPLLEDSSAYVAIFGFAWIFCLSAPSVIGSVSLIWLWRSNKSVLQEMIENEEWRIPAPILLAAFGLLTVCMTGMFHEVLDPLMVRSSRKVNFDLTPLNLGANAWTYDVLRLGIFGACLMIVSIFSWFLSTLLCIGGLQLISQHVRGV